MGQFHPRGKRRADFALVKTAAVVSAEGLNPQDQWPVIEVDVAGAVIGDGPIREAADAAPAVALDPEDPACIYFTSGTTGDAKALVKDHGHFARAPEAHLRFPEFRPTMADPEKPPTLSFNPFGQSASFSRLGFSLYVGRPLLLVRKFDIETVEQVAVQFRPKTLQLTPAMVHMLAFAESEIDLSSVRYVNSATAPLPPHTRDAFEQRYGIPVLQVYGATEGGVQASERLEDVLAGLRGPGSVGRILTECAWRIVDPSGRDVSAGEEGEILGRPDERVVLTAEGESSLPMDNAGWYHTGDIGRVDQHGILYITGRLKEMLIVGGFNVFPTEVEDVLRSSPLVLDTVVVPVADERLGEIPVAGVVWDKRHAAALDEVEGFRGLEVAARDQLAAYKVPRRWFTLPEVPLTPNGKPDRRAAARIAASEAGSIDDLESGAAALEPDGAGT